MHSDCFEIVIFVVIFFFFFCFVYCTPKVEIQGLIIQYEILLKTLFNILEDRFKKNCWTLMSVWYNGVQKGQ